MVNKVTRDGFIFPKYDTREYSVIIPEGEYVDESRELKAICTDIVVNHFLKTHTSIYNFMKVIVRSYEKALIYYIKQKKLPTGSILFLCKGGNILRIISYEFEKNFPAVVVGPLIDYYKSFFKRSDADFSIYINAKGLDGQDYETIYNEITNIAYLIQFILRDHFLNNATLHFDYYKLSDADKNATLETVLKQLNSSSSATSDSGNSLYQGAVFKDISYLDNNAAGQPLAGYGAVSQDNESKLQKNASINDSLAPDIAIQNIDGSDKNVAVFPISEGKTPFFISNNTTLAFEAGPQNTLVKFNLVRTKVNFNLYYEKDGTKYMKYMGGELIDVSIPHKDSEGMINFFDEINKNVASYTLTFNNDEKFKYKAYSIRLLAEDLENVLFHQSNMPWEDGKYAKRMNRLFYMYLVDILDKYSPSQTLQILLDIQEQIFIPFRFISAKTWDESANNHLYNLWDAEVKRLKDGPMASILSKYPGDRVIMVNIIKILPIVAGNSFNEQSLYDTFSNIIHENMLRIITFISDYITFFNNTITNKGRILHSKIYNADITSLTGGQGTNAKYLKYKYKYLKATNRL
jgi:hypothetical protein